MVDFLHFKIWRGYSWPDFNLADSFIVVGVGLLVLELLASEGEDRAAPEPDEPAALKKDLAAGDHPRAADFVFTVGGCAAPGVHRIVLVSESLHFPDTFPLTCFPPLR